MKTTVDSPEFTAWLLGELPREQAAAFERAVAADPAMQLAAREQQQFLQQVSGLLGGSPESLDGRQREKILSAARSRGSAEVLVMPVSRGTRSWGWITLATAAVAVMGVWLGWQNPLKTGKGSISLQEVTREIALLPTDAAGFPQDASGASSGTTTAVGGGNVSAQRDALWNRQPDEYLRVIAKRIAADPLPSAAELPVLRERGFVEASQHPLAPLPLRVGTASWSWIKRSILEQQTLPHPSMVRVEEVINAFVLPSGNEATVAGCTARTLLIDSSATTKRVLLSLHNGTRSPQSIEWSYLAPAGSRYRLVGFGAGTMQAAAAAALPQGTSVLVMLEVQQPAAGSVWGDLRFRIAEQEGSLPVESGHGDAVDAGFFSLLVDYCAWLRQPDSSQTTLLEAMTRLETQALTPEQLTAVSLMKKSLALKNQ
jgi:hypothetical protein